MINSSKALAAAFIFPIVALLILTGVKAHRFANGDEIIFKVSGYDPRDLLSGHYVTYVVDYGVLNACSNVNASTPVSQNLCFDDGLPRVASLGALSKCRKMISGTCKNGRFESGIERFYIPDDRAAELDAKVRGKEASILVSISGGGHAQVKDLLINGKSWREQ